MYSAEAGGADPSVSIHGMTFAMFPKKLSMDTRFQHLTAAQLRTIIIHEMRKFALALEYGSAISDLHEIREQIKVLGDTLALKEHSESHYGSVEKTLQSDRSVSAA